MEKRMKWGNRERQKGQAQEERDFPGSSPHIIMSPQDVYLSRRLQDAQLAHACCQLSTHWAPIVASCQNTLALDQTNTLVVAAH